MANKSKTVPNALKHGAFAKTVLLPWESAREFQALHQELRDEWQPSGALEEDAVHTILNCLWRKRRVRARRNLQLTVALKQPALVELTHTPVPFFQTKRELVQYKLKNGQGGQPSNGLPRGELEDLVHFSRTLFGNMSLHALKLGIGWLGPEISDHLNRNVPIDKFEKLIDWVEALKKEVDDVLIPKSIASRASDTDDTHLNAKASEFFTAERIMEDNDLEDRLDSMIDRAIRRLAQAKMMKQITLANRPSQPATSKAKQIEVKLRSPSKLK